MDAESRTGGGATSASGHVRRHLYTARIPVRWIDQDTFGHVNNAAYFTYFEQARVDWLASVGDAAKWTHRVGPVVVHTSCTYKRPLAYPAVAEVALFCETPGRSSFTTWYEIRRAGEPELCALGEARLVWLDIERGRPITLPEGLRRIMEGAAV